MAATEEYGRTHSITEGREREIQAELHYAASRLPIREQFTHPDPQRRFQEREKTGIMENYPPHLGVVNAFDDPAFLASNDPYAIAYRRTLDALPFGSDDPDESVLPQAVSRTVGGTLTGEI